MDDGDWGFVREKKEKISWSSFLTRFLTGFLSRPLWVLGGPAGSIFQWRFGCFLWGGAGLFQEEHFLIPGGGGGSVFPWGPAAAFP